MKRTPLRKGTTKLKGGSKGLKRSSGTLKAKGGLKSSKNGLKSRPKSKEVLAQSKLIKEKMLNMFVEIWKKRGPYSELSGIYLGMGCKTIYMHHILPKKIYKELTLIPENIIILSFEEHQKVESDTYFYPEINRRREKLKIKFGL